MGEEFKAKYIIIWSDGIIRGFNTYSETSKHINDCMEDEYCTKLQFRVFCIIDNSVEEIYL